MSALKFKNNLGEWQSIPMIRGKKGDKGDTGETGNSGVYIGTEAPTDEYINVWIDTDGQPDSVTGLKTVKDAPNDGGTLIGAVDGISANSATGYCSLAQGLSTISSGNYSHAEGVATESAGLYSHSEGWHTRATKRSQHVMGEYNIIDEGTNVSNANERGEYALIIGNGTNDNSRSNAFALKWDGTFVLANGSEIAPYAFTVCYRLGAYYQDQGSTCADIIGTFNQNLPMGRTALISNDGECYYYSTSYFSYINNHVWSTPVMYDKEDSTPRLFIKTFTSYDLRKFTYKKVYLDELATTTTRGFMSATDKQHLDSVYADYSSALTALGVI